MSTTPFISLHINFIWNTHIHSKWLSGVWLVNADNLYNQQRLQIIYSMHFQPNIDDYYGYNSILNQQGKRVRRMRRTEASLQKLFQSKIKTLPSRSASSKRSQLSLSKQMSPISLSRFDSNCKLGSLNLGSDGVFNSSENDVRRINHKDSSKVSKQPSRLKQYQVKGVKQTMGQYYICKDSQQLQSIEKQSSKQQNTVKLSYNLKRSNITTNNLNHHSNNTSRRTLNKTEKSQTVISPFQPQQNKTNPTQSNKQKQSSSRLVLSKSSSKFSKISMNQNSSNSKSIISNSESTSKVLSSHVRFQQNLPQRQDCFNQNYQLSSLIKSKKSSAVKNSVHNQPSQISNYSKQISHVSSHASKIRSKVHKREEASKISNISKDSEKAIVSDNKGKMLKKQTQATQSNLSNSISENQSIHLMHKAQKAKGAYQKETKAKFNPQNGSFLKESSKLSDYQGQQPVKNIISIPAPKIAQSIKITKKKSVGSYTFNDVVQNIEEHQIRLGSLYLFVDSTKNKYQGSIKFQRYERLCFLILKKYLLEKNRMIRSLKGEQNCFILTNAQIPGEVLKKHMSRQQVRQRLSLFIDESKQISMEVKAEFDKISSKYQKDKYIKLQALRDNFSSEIMRLLMEELTKLYQELQQQDIQNQQIDANEQRIIQIIQIMFLLSELSGRTVKPFELYQQNIVDFQQYYSQNYESIMETAQYFQKYA